MFSSHTIDVTELDVNLRVRLQLSCFCVLDYGTVEIQVLVSLITQFQGWVLWNCINSGVDLQLNGQFDRAILRGARNERHW
jgi:hypothetical protein